MVPPLFLQEPVLKLPLIAAPRHPLAKFTHPVSHGEAAAACAGEGAVLLSQTHSVSLSI
jgi:hypothetical protein